jgi:lipopolysaccharide export system protein LptA
LPRFLSILLLAAPALCAQETAPDVKKNPISLLPDGSVLKGVLLPRYDEERNLVGDLKAETMTLIDSKRVQGENVLIRFYNPDRSLRGKVHLDNALFDQEKSRLSANEPVRITTDRLVARGSGLVYAFQGGEGFLRGPVTTWISAPPTATSMNANPLHTAALFALCLAQAPLIAAPPAFVTEEEIAALKAEAASVKPEADKITASAEANLTESVAKGDEASTAALAFIKTSEIKAIAAEATEKEPEAKPLEVKPGPDDTLITCEGGMYFDADEGVLVYLKNVKVTDPRFNLVAGGQLKVFFDKKPEKKKPGDTEKKGETQAGPANFGDVKKLVAEGAVVIDQKGVGGKDPVKASGSILTYDVPEGEIIIHGGYPWVKQGTYYARAMEPNLTLRLLNSGSFSTQGNWQMGGNMNLKGN